MMGRYDQRYPDGTVVLGDTHALKGILKEYGFQFNEWKRAGKPKEGLRVFDVLALSLYYLGYPGVHDRILTATGRYTQ